MRAGAGGALLCSAIGLACADLPSIQPFVCGNAVVEAREDCDTFAPVAGAVCRPKGTVGECHWDCQSRPDGTRPPCPAAWGCSQEGICRAPTGAFESPATYPGVGAWTLHAGDFDRDGREDILGCEPYDAVGRTRIRYHYFDDHGALAQSREFTKLLFSPLVVDANGDGRSDIAFSEFRIGVLPGRADRALIPETFVSYRFADTQVRMVAVYRDSVEDTISSAAILTHEGTSGFFVVDPRTGTLRLQGAIPAPIEALSGEPRSGNIIEDPLSSPCNEVVLAVRGRFDFSLFDLCAGESSKATWRDQVLQWTVTLDPAKPIDSGMLIVDLNHDGHLDVLVGAGGITYAAYGDGGKLATAVPYWLNYVGLFGDTEPIQFPMPLAAGDVTGDGAVDFVLGDHLLMSSTSPWNGQPRYGVPYTNFGSRWTNAAIEDINGNGNLDVIAASSDGINIDVFNGTGTEFLTDYKLSTQAPVKRLVIGDFDGDLIKDIAYTEVDSLDSRFDAVRIAFGGYQTAPLSANQVARVDSSALIVPSPELGIDDLLIVSNHAHNGSPVADLSMLFGGDRLPYAPLQLSSYVEDGSVVASAAFGLSIGAFSKPHQPNLLALATPTIFSEGEDWRFWLVPSVTDSESRPVRLEGTLDPRLAPSFNRDFSGEVSIGTGSGDFDGDGLDEALWAIPADGRAHCGLVFVGATTGGLGQRRTMILDQPCLRAQLRAFDLDEDGHLDIAMLMRGARGATNKLVVLWNDGHGGFSNSEASLISGSDSPEQFTFLPASHQRPSGVAYVTEQDLVLLPAIKNSRTFSERQILAAIERGSGIAAADVNGDGAVDLVVAASGTVHVLKAELSAQ